MQRYFPQLRYEMGQLFPFPNPFDGEEGPLVVTHSEGITIVIFSNHALQDAEALQGLMTLGLMSYRNLPMLGMEVEGLRMVHNLNVFSIIGDERAAWLRGPHGPITVMLVDNQTGLIKSMRSLVVEPMQQKLREVAATQLTYYQDAEQVNAMYERLTRQYDIDAIMKGAQEREQMRLGEPGSWYVKILPPNI